jgi:hypothetical protein
LINEEKAMLEYVEEAPRKRSRKPKAPPPPSKKARLDKVKQQIEALEKNLRSAGFEDLLKPPQSIQSKIIAEQISDKKTGSYIAHVQEDLGSYLQRVAIVGNFFQRQPYDHVEDKVYRRLIRDFIEGAEMPEAKVAIMRTNGAPAESLDETDIRYSVIDGLQRLYCFAIAVLLVWKREALVAEGSITKKAWMYFADIVEEQGEPNAAVANLLRRTVRYEAFWNIDLGGLLHYMVTFNTGQRRMNIEVQLEIMQRPLLDRLENFGQIEIFRDTDRPIGTDKPKGQFAASDLIVATRAFIEANPQVKKVEEAEELLEMEPNVGMDNLTDIEDILLTLQQIGKIHQELKNRYAGRPNQQNILTTGGLFLLGLAAACGKIRLTQNRKVLEGVLERLQNLLASPGDDPFNLEEYQETVNRIHTSRGKTTRRIIYDTFLRFFNGAAQSLDWADTARQSA